VSRRRSRTSWFLAWAGLLFLSLRPSAPAQHAVDVVVAPLRFVGELSSPLRLASRHRVLAAEERLARGAQAEARENRRLLEELARCALPTDPALLRDRRVVHAEVEGREPGNRDRIRVRLRDARGLVPGLPVACGDSYVGRLVEVAADAGDGRGSGVVELVTGLRVGGRVAAPPGSGGSDVLLTVGGVVPRPRRAGPGGEILLAVHNPSDRPPEGGLARVWELFDDAEPFRELAAGLVLGRIRGADAAGSWAIVPELDYVDGLFQVVVLAPLERGLGSAVPFEPVLMDSRWVSARPLGVGDPSPWRSTTKIDVGSRRGVRAGAAVTSIGARLIGRVTHAGLLTSDVSFLDDEGFSVVAVARVAGTPRVLGRLISEGRDEDGAIRFRWIVRARQDPLEAAEGARRARLFTGSGDPGLPAGFGLGEAELPLDVEPGEERELRVITDVDPRDLRTLFVRTGAERGST